MTVITHLLDKIFFALGVIIFLQLPHFIDQYTQRMGGFAASETQQLAEHQRNARNNFKGDLNALINDFKASDNPAVQQTGKNIENTQNNVKELDQDLETLESNNLLKRSLFLLTNIRYDLAKGTLASFQPGVPLSLWAFVYGLIGGILFSLLFNGCILVPKSLIKKRKKSTFRTT